MNTFASMRVNARLGYEVRTLLAAANILARNGKQQPCEETLSAAGDVYKVYVVDLKSRNIPKVDTSSWREQQIAAAKPVSEQTVPLRSDELLGTDVRNLIARGGLFGIGGQFVPVPWSHFKVTPKLNLLVLATTKGAMEDAPRIDYRFSLPKNSLAQDQKADVYWKTRLSETND